MKRRPRGHHADPHDLVGQPLALLEAEVALTSLFERFPHLGLAVPAEEITSQGTFIMNGVERCPCGSTPERQPP
jgi:cytochrome P450